ncbi:OmpA family protein [Bacteroidota bacterium]
MSYFKQRVVAFLFIITSLVSYGQNVEKDTLVSTSVFQEEPYNTWSVGAGFTNIFMHGDMRSFGNADGINYLNFGLYGYVDRMFNPILGVEFKMFYSSLGGGRQSFSNPEGSYYDILYTFDFPNENFYMDGTAFGGEVGVILSLDNLWKHNSEKWNFNIYAGVGFQKYNSRLIIRDYDPLRFIDDVSDEGVVIEADFGFNKYRKNSINFAKSLFLNAGLGLKYRLNKKIDLELRSTIYLNHEDHFDAAISRQQDFEDFIVTGIGAVYKFGNKDKHAIWYHEPEIIEEDPFELPDTDGDGVADLFDKEEETPKDAQVYGNGVAIDSDKDGLQDYKDNCPLVPGPIENIGCPYPMEEVVDEIVQDTVAKIEPIKESEKKRITDKIALLSKSIFFKTASSELKAESFKPLNEIAGIMIEYPQSKFKIEGHTDSRGKALYNLKLSESRSKSVYTYFVDKNGIASDRLSSKGYGEERPVATNETETGRQSNRRVEINFIDPDSEEGRRVYGNDVTFTRKSSTSASAFSGFDRTKLNAVMLDSDGDGVTDLYDKEPNTPENVKVYGNGVSVDSDNDGIPDYQDNCPFEKGTIGHNGCSDEIAKEDIKLNYSIENVDTDHDGVADVYDKEPNTPSGVKVYGNGVSVDSDNDGIPDYQDNCPFEKGDLSKNGCPEKTEVIVDKVSSEDVEAVVSEKFKDSDGDGVIDLYDKENNTPSGVKVYGNGVSVDSDNDGVADYKDNCPFEKGDLSKNGCPEKTEVITPKVSSADVEAVVSGKFMDTDGDGVLDLYDKEPNTPKESRVYGDGVSIDSDNDGIPDYKDDCPFEKGIASKRGCPLVSKAVINTVPTTSLPLRKKNDSDGDGVADDFDKEPNTPANVKVYANGVAIDSDKDGIPDYKDECPNLRGIAAKNGCPEKEDLDGDGIEDQFDLCPDIKGTAANNGCPNTESLSNIGDQLSNLASRIHFSRSEGHIIKSNNIAILSQIADKLNNYKATKFRIEVHTTARPNLKYNLELSKRRAYAINKYLTKNKGIAQNRIEVVGLGGSELKYLSEDDPKYSENDRVEVKIK